jgi:hypothetical protein
MKTVLLTIVFIIIVSSEMQGQKFNYSNSFDNYSNDTTLSIGTEVNNIWEIGSSTKGFFEGSNRATKPSIMTDTIDPYPINNISTFEIDFGNTFFRLYHMFVFQFDHKFQTDIGNDGGYIEISYDDGITWNNFILDTLVTLEQTMVDGVFSNFYSKEDTLTDGTPAFTGQSDDWIISGISWFWTGIDYSWIDEDGIDLKLRFVFKSDDVNDNKAGWIIDNIILGYGNAESIEESINSFSSQLFPNPIFNESILKFENPMNSNVYIQIFNSSGLKIMETKTNSNYIKLIQKDFKEGLYIYKIVYERDNTYSIGEFIVN